MRTITADAIGDTQYCPSCGSELENIADDGERGDRRCSNCGNYYKQYTLSYLKEIIEPESRGELTEQIEENGLEVLKTDTVEGDEDIDIYRPNTNLRIERLSHGSVYVAGYSGGDENNIDYRYWFTVRDGELEIDREIVRNNE